VIAVSSRSSIAESANAGGPMRPRHAGDIGVELAIAVLVVENGQCVSAGRQVPVDDHGTLRGCAAFALQRSLEPVGVGAVQGCFDRALAGAGIEDFDGEVEGLGGRTQCQQRNRGEHVAGDGFHRGSLVARSPTLEIAHPRRHGFATKRGFGGAK
jgi:hypothetical protein